MTAISWFGFPLRSHTVPSLPVVSALIAAGVDVTFYTVERYRPMVEATGARVVSYPPICDRLAHGKDVHAHVRDVIDVSRAIAPSLAASISKSASAPPADMVIFDASAFWGRIVARECGLPSASSVTTFVFTRSMLQLMARSTPMSDEDIDVLATAGDLKIAYTSRSFQPAGQFLDDTHLFVGPLLEGRPRDGVRVEPEGTRPLAYVSLGTLFNDNVALLRQIASHLSSAGWEVVVSLGGGGASEAGAASEWPPHVRAYPFVDQLGVLAHARLVVSHGGLQTVIESLALGVPLIIIPQGADQHVVAQRAAGLGAALVLGEQSAVGETFVAALTRIDAERSRFESAARAIGRGFAEATTLTPLAVAVERLIDLPAAAARRAT